MLGPEGVARAITARLRADLPGTLGRLRTKYGVTVAELPAPETDNIHPHEEDVVEIGAYPSMMVTVQNAGGRAAPIKNSDVSGVHTEYHFRYRVRIYFYVAASDYGPTAVLRFRYVLAIRETLFRNLRLFASETENIHLDELTLAEELEGGIGQLEGVAQLIGSGAISFEVVATERLDAIGDEGSFEIISDVEAVPVLHPIDLE